MANASRGEKRTPCIDFFTRLWQNGTGDCNTLLKKNLRVKIK